MNAHKLTIGTVAISLTLTACSTTNPKAIPSQPPPTSTQPKEPVADNPIQLSNEDKKLLNFLPELAAGVPNKYNFQSFKPAPTDQTVFPLQEGDANTTAFAFDRSRYAYIGSNLTPARIIKYDMQDMKRIASLDLPKGEGRDEVRVASLIALDSKTIIHASFTNPCVFTKIDGDTMTVTGTIQGVVEPVNDKFIRGMTYDGTYVYAANYSVPSKIIKIDPVSFQRVDAVSFTDEIGDVTAITIVGHDLVGVSGRDEDENAKIFRLDLRDLHQKPETLTIPGYSKYHSICTDGTNIYAGTFTDPTRVVKVDVSGEQMKFVQAFQAEPGQETGNFSIVYDGTDVVVGTWNLEPSLKDHLIKLDPATMSRKATLTTPIKFPADLMYLEPYYYTSTDNPTGNVLRLKF